MRPKDFHGAPKARSPQRGTYDGQAQSYESGVVSNNCDYSNCWVSEGIGKKLATANASDSSIHAKGASTRVKREYSTDSFRNGRDGSGDEVNGRFRASIQDTLKTGNERKRMKLRWQLSVLRAVMIGAGLRGGFAAFSLIAKARRRKLVAEDVRVALTATLRYAAFLGTFSATYVAADEKLANLFGRHRSKHWRAAAAGALAGPSLLLTGHSDHTSLALYIFLRSVVLLARCGFKRGERDPALRAALSPLQYRHGDVLLMCMAASQLTYAFIHEPTTLPGNYIKFLQKQVGKDGAILQAMAILGKGVDVPSEIQRGCEIAARHLEQQPPPYAARHLANRPEALAQVISDLRNPAVHVLQNFHKAIMHPGESCWWHCLNWLWDGGMKRALPIYIPVYLLPAMLVHRKKLLTAQGPEVMQRAALGALRSSTFLAMYVSLCWGGVCTVQHLVGHPRAWTVMAGTFAGGLATFLEKKSRRMELALYCMSRALESYFLCARRWGYINPNWKGHRVDVLLFCAATASIMHCYNTERDVFKSKYLNVLDWVFGNTGHNLQRIRHVSSIQDIISRLPPMYSYDANVTHPSSASSSIGEASASDGESVESCDEGDCVDETRERKQQ